MSKRLIALAAAGLSLAAVPSANARPSTFPDDHSFIVNAARSNLAEIATGRIALRESDTAGVRAFARRMIADHTKAQADLTRVAREWDTTVPRRPSPQQRQEAARLERLSGAAFDRTYLRRQVVAHRKTLGLCLLEINGGQVADVRDYAARTAPVVRMHLDMAQALR
jgi:putative membrane protein